MAFLWPNGPLTTISLRVGGLLTVADDLDVITVPITGRIVAVHVTVTTTGATSGNNDFVLELNGTDMYTVAAGVGRIAYNASNKYLDMDMDDFTTTLIEAGDTLALNGNAIAGTACTDLTVDIYVIPDGK